MAGTATQDGSNRPISCNREPPPAPVAMASTPDGKYESWDMVASGLAGVWATENTREAIFDAMQRKETYATTGPRMLVRFFGGWEFTDADARSRLPGSIGYSKGVPMGGNLPPPAKGKTAPTFLVAAMKDPFSGNLDRIQIIKVYLDSRLGRSVEKIYDVALADGREADKDGNVPPVGNTVDIEKGYDSDGLADLVDREIPGLADMPVDADLLETRERRRAVAHQEPNRSLGQDQPHQSPEPRQ